MQPFLAYKVLFASYSNRDAPNHKMTKKSTHKAILSILSLTFILLQSLIVFPQSDDDIMKAMDSIKHKSDSVYGLDFELVNGPIYYQKNLFALGDPFFGSSDWFDGQVRINGILHTGLKLKYNIELDQLIMLVTLKSGLATTIIMNEKHVVSFSLEQQHFISTSSITANDIKAVYVHEIYQGSFTLLASYKKNFINDYNTKTPYGKYSDRQSTYFIEENGVVTKIGNKKTLLTYFESVKKEISKYMKKNGFKFKKANSRQWHSLMLYCDELINSSSQ